MAFWTGNIVFGMVSISVKLETAHQNGNGLRTNLVHEECMSKVKQRYRCEECTNEFEQGDLVKAYTYNGKLIVLDAIDLQEAEPVESRSIEVCAFVPKASILPERVIRTYYLQPEKTSLRAYMLLMRAIKKTRKAGVVRFVMRNHEYVGAIVWNQGGLVLHILAKEGNLKDIKKIIDLPKTTVRRSELELGVRLIESMETEFSESLLKDEHSERLLATIEKKAGGNKTKKRKSSSRAKPPTDIMEQLKQSLFKGE